MVSRHCLLHILHRPGLRHQHFESELPELRLEPLGPRLRFPIRRFPLHRRRVLWHPRLEPELGLHDAEPRHLR